MLKTVVLLNVFSGFLMNSVDMTYRTAFIWNNILISLMHPCIIPKKQKNIKKTFYGHVCTLKKQILKFNEVLRAFIILRMFTENIPNCW